MCLWALGFGLLSNSDERDSMREFRVGKRGVPFFRVTFLLLLFLSQFGCQALEKLKMQNGWSTFRSPCIAGFAIDYPSTWKDERFSNGYRGDGEIVAIFYSRLQLFPVVEIAYQEGESPTLEEVSEWGERRIKALNSDSDDLYELSDIVEIDYDEMNMWMREYTMDLETSSPVKKKDMYIARENDAIIITFMDELQNYDASVNQFDHMVSTFRTLPLDTCWQ